MWKKDRESKTSNFLFFRIVHPEKQTTINSTFFIFREILNAKKNYFYYHFLNSVNCILWKCNSTFYFLSACLALPHGWHGMKTMEWHRKRTACQVACIQHSSETQASYLLLSGVEAFFLVVTIEIQALSVLLLFSVR